MKKKLTVIISMLLACMLLFTMTGCGSGVNWCACFDTAEEVWNLFDKEKWGYRDYKEVKGSDAWKYMELPADERFEDADYFIFSICVDVDMQPDCSLIVYRVNIDGEYITVIFGANNWLSPITVEASCELKNLNEYTNKSLGALNGYFHYFTTDPEYKVGCWKNHTPTGMIKDITSFESAEAAGEYFKSLTSVGIFDSNGRDIWYLTWFIDDNRDVPQSEKDVLALELAGVLFDHYVEAGFIQLYDK